MYDYGGMLSMVDPEAVYSTLIHFSLHILFSCLSLRLDLTF
jgi:hypothetical protein